MATYVIGDVQGCFASLEALLQTIAYKPGEDRLWFVGDLINRGPDSLGVMDFALQHERDLTVVLGNHELHFLSVVAGARKARAKDTFGALLSSKRRDDYVDWLRHRSATIVRAEHILVHAGILPRWSATEVIELNAGIEEALRGDQWQKFLHQVQAQEELRWEKLTKRKERLAVALKAMTMLRVVDRLRGDLDLSFKGEVQDIPATMVPWFDHPERRLTRRKIYFGHWAGLSLFVREDVLGLDSGCVWGRSLTAVRMEDQRLFQVPVAAGDSVEE